MCQRSQSVDELSHLFFKVYDTLTVFRVQGNPYSYSRNLFKTPMAGGLQAIINCALLYSDLCPRPVTTRVATRVQRRTEPFESACCLAASPLQVLLEGVLSALVIMQAHGAQGAAAHKGWGWVVFSMIMSMASLVCSLWVLFLAMEGGLIDV